MGGLVALDFAARHAAELAAAVVLEPMAIAPELLAGLRPILQVFAQTDTAMSSQG